MVEKTPGSRAWDADAGPMRNADSGTVVSENDRKLPRLAELRSPF